MIYKNIINFCAIAVLCGCAHIFTPKTEETKKHYSSETDRYFEAIEKSRIYVDELPLESSKPKKLNEVKSSKTPKKIVPDAMIVRELKIKGNQNKVRELNQILSFHCMKHRKRFGDEAQCIARVNQSIDRCEEKHTKVNSAFSKCIKSQLKNI